MLVNVYFLYSILKIVFPIIFFEFTKGDNSVIVLIPVPTL